MNKEKKKPLACINGIKGAISLFMAVLMTPFLTIALILVETGRYNSAVSMLDELMGVSSLSTLAHYDSFVQDRWGLLAISQENELTDIYNGYLQTNSEIMGDSLIINTVEAEGVFSLAERKILKNQIMEYAKLNAPTHLVYNFGNIEEFIGILEKFSNFGTIMKGLTSGVKILDSAITIGENAEKIKESSAKLDDLVTEYENKYSAFEQSVSTLISTFQQIRSLENQERSLNRELTSLKEELAELTGEKETEPGEEPPPTTEATEPEEESEEIKELREEIADVEADLRSVKNRLRDAKNSVSSKQSAANTAKNNYADTLDTIATELQNFRDLLKESNDAIKEVEENILTAAQSAFEIDNSLKRKKENLSTLSKEIDYMEAQGTAKSDPEYAKKVKQKADLDKEVADLEAQIAISDAGGDAIGGMISDWNTTVENYSEEVIDKVIAAFGSLSAKVRAYNVYAVTADSAYITRAEYKSQALAGYITEENIEAYLEEQNKKLKKGPLKAVLKGLQSVYEQVMGLSVFFEDNLNSNIDINYYTEKLGGLPADPHTGGAIGGILYNLGSAMASLASFTLNFQTFRWLKAIKNLKTLAQSLINLITEIGNLVKMLFDNIIGLFTYENWWMSTYCAYNLPCRTDYSKSSQSVSMKTLTGYSVTKESLDETRQSWSVPIFGGITALIDTISTWAGNSSGKDLAFSGAEVEYIMFGSNSEAANQLYAFCLLYIIRVLCSISAISANVEVQALAAATTLGYPVVMGLYYVLEPLVQTVLLANGSAQSLIPTTVYLAPSGIPSLIEELVNFCNLSEATSESITKGIEDAVVEAEKKDEYTKKMGDHKISTTKKPTTQKPGEKLASDYKKSLLKFEYRDYCFVIIMLLVSNDERYDRLMNLIQMECTNYYVNQKATYIFDLKKAYTFLDVDVNATVNQMLPTLIESSKFTVNREHYRGY